MPFKFKLSKRLALLKASLVASAVLALACDRSDLTSPQPPPSLRADAVPPLPVASVTASANDGNIPQNTLDNNLATRWAAWGDGQWIRYDLGAVGGIGGVDVAWYLGDMRSAHFDIQVSLDTVTWTTVFSGQSSGQTLQVETYVFPTVSARYVRIVGHGHRLHRASGVGGDRSRHCHPAPGREPPAERDREGQRGERAERAHGDMGERCPSGRECERERARLGPRGGNRPDHGDERRGERRRGDHCDRPPQHQHRPPVLWRAHGLGREPVQRDVPLLHDAARLPTHEPGRHRPLCRRQLHLELLRQPRDQERDGHRTPHLHLRYEMGREDLWVGLLAHCE